MSLFIVDVEADGPVPGLYSMVSFGVVKLNEHLDTKFKGLTKPISNDWNQEALAISNISRETHLTYPDPFLTMSELNDWVLLHNVGKAVFLSDNPAFDWQFINYYFHKYLKTNPFGKSARRIGDLYSGLVNDFYASSEWKKLIITPHTHDPLDDAMGNAEALLKIKQQFNFNIPFK